MPMQTVNDRHLTPGLVRREQERRRVVLLSIAALIVLGTSPVFGHHLASRVEVLLAGLLKMKLKHLPKLEGALGIRGEL